MLKGRVQTARNYKQKTLPKILPSFGRAIKLASRALEQLGHMMKCRNSEGFSEAVNRIALWESCRDSSTREIHLRILPKIHLNMKLGRAIELASSSAGRVIVEWMIDVMSYARESSSLPENPITDCVASFLSFGCSARSHHWDASISPCTVRLTNSTLQSVLRGVP